MVQECYAHMLIQLALSRDDLFAFCCLAHPLLYDCLKGQQTNKFLSYNYALEQLKNGILLP